MIIKDSFVNFSYSSLLSFTVNFYGFQSDYFYQVWEDGEFLLKANEAFIVQLLSLCNGGHAVLVQYYPIIMKLPGRYF